METADTVNLILGTLSVVWGTIGFFFRKRFADWMIRRDIFVAGLSADDLCATIAIICLLFIVIGALRLAGIVRGY